MDRPGFDVLAFLNERHRPASVATVTGRGEPALASMWFLFGEGRFWFHSPEPEEEKARNPFLEAARRQGTVAVMVATFDARARVLKVRATGRARLESADLDRVRAIYDRYLGPPVDKWSPGWEAQAADPAFCLWSVEAERGSAVDYPALEEGGGMVRWSSAAELVAAITAGPHPAG